MQYYQALRDAREDSDLAQKEIAGILKITTQQYQLYESGQREIPSRFIKELALFYKISADYLLGITREPKPLFTKEVKI